jgi:translation initiation factor 3 subunit D
VEEAAAPADETFVLVDNKVGTRSRDPRRVAIPTRQIRLTRFESNRSQVAANSVNDPPIRGQGLSRSILPNRLGTTQRRNNWRDRQTRLRPGGVDIKDNWELRDTLSFVVLQKLWMQSGAPTAETILSCGTLPRWRKPLNSIDYSRKDKPEVVVSEKGVLRAPVAATSDGALRRVVEEGQVFATVDVMAALMTATRSVNGWEMVAHRVGEDKLFLDKHGSSLDWLSTGETAQDPPLTERELAQQQQQQQQAAAGNATSSNAGNASGNASSSNNPPQTWHHAFTALTQEATLLNATWPHVAFENSNSSSSQEGGATDVADVLGASGKGKYTLAPHETARTQWEAVAPCVQIKRYMLPMEEGKEIAVCVRTMLHGVMEMKDASLQSVQSYALNEWENSHEQWRKRLPSQRGAVMAAEMRNNAAKLGRWTAAALISEAQLLSLAFATRVNPTELNKHEILSVQSFRPKDIAAQMNLNMENIWAVLREIVAKLMSYPPGTYAVVKDAQKSTLSIYQVHDMEENAAGPGGSNVSSAYDEE